MVKGEVLSSWPRGRALFSVLLAAVVVVGLLALAGVRPAEAAFPGENGKIAFIRVHSSNGYDVYTINPDGSGEDNLTHGQGDNRAPVWSPDGKQIAFSSDRDGSDSEIYVMNADGSGLERLTDNATYDFTPTWSPDGTKIAYAGVIDGGNDLDVIVVNADGSDPVDVTQNTTAEFDPTWSADDKIAYQSFPDCGPGYCSELFVMNPDGSEQERLTNDQIMDEKPAWSPDGTELVFDRRPTGTYIMIHTINADGTGLTDIGSQLGGSNLHPSWSPDGAKIAFTDGQQLLTANPDGTGKTAISSSVGNYYELDWGVAAEQEDATAPTISLTTPADGASYKLDETVNAEYSCEDEPGGSGLESCTGTLPNGSAIDTSVAGANKTFTVTARDEAGNETTKTATYSVVYDFEGFFSPVNNLPTFNSTKAGSAIPVKFGLGGDQGLDIFEAGYPRSQQVACDSSATVDGIEQTVTANQSGLSYDAQADQYNYVWKTEKGWSGTCRQVVVKLKDGTSHRANFRFK